MRNKKLERITRKTFHKIQIVQGKNKRVFGRLWTLLNADYLGLGKKYFIDKVCLDVGCGSNANATFAMLKMGAKKVYAFDLDKSIFKCAQEILAGFEGRYNLSIGNVLNINFEDNFFDFVHCAGVLHHTANAFKGIKELARVTKPGGILCISISGQDGLVTNIIDLLRKKYKKDAYFKKIIDNLKDADFIRLWKWIVGSMKKHGDMTWESIPLQIIKELFDSDLVLTIKDRITAPIYNRYTKKQIVGYLRKCGFKRIKRLTRYPRIKNIRRFLCPFYYDYNHKFSRFFYGDGFIQIRAQKAK